MIESICYTWDQDNKETNKHKIKILNNLKTP